ncbi:RNA-directed DNA polymerase from mobile element jockey-like Protein [Elysia marginata]|uniref:RNA-directed DNA polymerase from mobile element jockey-like Protein n=1 Tax=Elysia marginata TaxID=1093978 RepID=A0AAV4EYH7_9GAST|nr:RNA-directed DNA polymerase from mobile element jockey-like Protein [Elysia marginata]
MKHGIPQGCILSPTLFSMFMNDIQTILPKGVYGAIYADDMAIWATEEFTGTAQAHLQLALDALRMWTEKWLMKIDPEKTTFTTKFQTIRLKIGEHQLREEPSSTYLGVTFDKRLTWKAQTDKCQERGILYGTTIERPFACGMRCTNYNAETEAIKEALNMVNNKIFKTSKVVILSDARSALQTLENTKDTELDNVRKKNCWT